MPEPISTETFPHGLIARVWLDDDPVNPRENYDNVATMACWHKGYSLGDVSPGRAIPAEYDPYAFCEHLLKGYTAGTDCVMCSGTGYTDYETCEHCDGAGHAPAEKLWGIAADFYYILPLYIYDHCGLSMRTERFSGGEWDSGQVGWIYVTKERAAKEWGADRSDDEYLEFMRNEVKEYDHYLQGNCYGYTVENAEGDCLESCWGFLGDKAYCKLEMREAAQRCVAKAEAEDAERAYWQSRDVVTVEACA